MRIMIMWLWVILLMLVLARQCCGCLEKERIALLQLKASINHPNGHSLPTWEESYSSVAEEETTDDCCEWESVQCNASTRRVVQLSLYYAREYGIGDWYLNASMFLPFEELQSLDLTSNSIVGWLENEGFEKLAKLSNLEVLDLSGNGFNNSILSTLGGLTSLKSLDLGFNKLEGTIHIDNFKGLKNLQELGISYNKLHGFRTRSGFERLSVLDKLEVLELEGNLFDNSIIPSLGVLSSLKALNIRRNYLNGSIHMGEFHNMSNLEELDLSRNSIKYIKGSRNLTKLKILLLKWNNFNASILESLDALISLKTLDMEGNELEGLVTRKGLDGLKHLQDLRLAYTSIDKSFLYHVGVLSSLRELSLRSSSLNGSLPGNGLCELSNLRVLDLSKNDFEGMLPSCFRNLTSIRLLDLSLNQFTGNLASSPLSHLTTLEYLFLSDNHLEIPVSFASFFNHSKLKVVLGDYNILSGDQIDQSQGWTPSFQLQYFILSNNCGSNKLGIELPHFLYYQYDLRIVDLSHNNLVGKLPNWFLENNTQLEVLKLKNNSLTGPFLLPSQPIPHLSFIDISNNNFEGNIPTSVGDLVSLIKLDLSNNNFSGQIPKQLAVGCSSLTYLGLSSNHLYGRILPSFANLTMLKWLYLDNNHFVGEIPNSLSTLTSLSGMDISNNHMSGKLARWIGNMSNLGAIAMFSNHFEGPIPVEFCKLDKLLFLDISKNKLSGSIPSCFNPPEIAHVHLSQNRMTGPMTHAFFNSSSLVTLDLSDNNLTGNIPSWIGSLSALSILLLKLNHFEGEIPIQICHLRSLSILDLSQNNFSGLIPPCFHDILSKTTHEKSGVPFSQIGGASTISPWEFVEGPKLIEVYFGSDFQDVDSDPYINVQQAEFTTKFGSYAYKGNILDYMSGIDLSCNHLTGEIPPEIGNLSNIHALNLSHNNLTGSIPTTFSHLRQIESLDLSYNNLNGKIPSELIQLGNIAVFSVAHNNLSGVTPDRKAQFATFEESSYEGNPLLCGPPLHDNNCSGTKSMPTLLPKAPVEDGGFIDMGIFYVSFFVSYITMVLAIAAILLINPCWRQAWFHLIEVCVTSCYYFVLDNFMKHFNRRSV